MKAILSCVALALLCAVAVGDDPKAKMDGTWELSKGTMDGNDLPDELLKSIKLTITGNDYEVAVGDQKIKGTSTVDEKASPKRMQLKDKVGPNAGKTVYAIYEVTKDELKACYSLEGTEYPKEFKAPAGSKLFYAVYKRSK